MPHKFNADCRDKIPKQKHLVTNWPKYNEGLRWRGDLTFWISLSLRDVEDLLAERGITVSHETVRFWVAKFGHQYAKSIRRDRPPVGYKWRLNEVVIGIRGVKYWLWRAADQNGNALDILVQSRRNTKAAKRFMRKLMKQSGVPRVLITDKLRSYGAAKRVLAPSLAAS